MILELNKAKDILRISGNDNDELIKSLLTAIPSYIEATTGVNYTNCSDPLVKTTAGFILQLWYYPQDKEADRLRKAIDGLLTTLTVIGRKEDG